LTLRAETGLRPDVESGIRCAGGTFRYRGKMMGGRAAFVVYPLSFFLWKFFVDMPLKKIYN